MKRVFSLRMKLIYIIIIILFICILLTFEFAFGRSRNLLIEQEAGIISQYMNCNQLALRELTNSIRKLSAASSTNKEVASYLNESYIGGMYAADNINRVSTVESRLTFYRNIFFDYRLHYIILGADDTIYSVVDGVDDSVFFGRNFSDHIKRQDWYQEFLAGIETSQWISPCVYNIKGEFKTEGSGKDETFLLFMRRIRDYNNQNFLGVSIVSFPIENLSQVLVPYEGSSMVLMNNQNKIIYADFQNQDGSADNLISLTSEATGDNGYFYHSLNLTEYLVNYVTVGGPDWKLFNLTPLQQTTKAVDELYDMVSLLMILIVCAAGIVCLAMYFYINAPLNRLFNKVSGVHIGGTRIYDREPVRQPIIGITGVEKEIGQMVDYIEKLSEQRIKQKEIEENLRFEMLRAQLTPHFLFNTLTAIKWSAMMSGAENIAGMITSLGTLLENSMSRKETEVALQEEVKTIQAWVDIKNWGLKNHIQLHTNIPEELLQFKVIKFCLQPLAENAVLHGMKNIENGQIWIHGCRDKGKVCIIVEDNGNGIDQMTMDKLMQEMDSVSRARHVTGIGIKSIHQLMKIKYGSEYGIHIETEIGRGTRICLLFPYEEGKQYAESHDRR